MLRIVKCVSETDFSAGSTAVDGKPNQNDERDNPEQYQGSNDLIAGEAHLVVGRGLNGYKLKMVLTANLKRGNSGVSSSSFLVKVPALCSR